MEEEREWEPTELPPWSETETTDEWLAWLRRHPIKARHGRALLIRYTGERNLMHTLGLLMAAENVQVTACTRMTDPEGRGKEFTSGYAIVCISEPKEP